MLHYLKPSFASVTAITAFVALTGASALLPAPAGAQGVLRLGHNRTWSNPALIIGLASGAFEKAGVKVVETEFSNPADMITAIVSGDIDACATPGPNLFTAVAKGVKVKAVAILQGNNVPPISYMVLNDSGINKMEDMRGKKAGVNNYGGNYDIYLRYWAGKHGLDPKKDMDVVVVPVPSMLLALVNRQIDMVPLAAFQQAQVLQRYPGRLKTIFTYEDVMKDGVGNTDNNSLVLAMGESYIQRNRATAIKFLEGYLRAVHAVNADQKKALDDWAKAVGNNALRNLPAPPVLPNDGKVYAKSLQFDADQAARFGYLDKKVDTRTMVDNSLIEVAAASMKK